jgi:hypothetical protein
VIGAVVISGLLSAFSSNVQHDPRISAQAKALVGVHLEGGVSFVSTDAVRAAATEAKLDQPTTDAIVQGYGEAQLRALKTGLLLAALLVCAAIPATRSLPTEPAPTRGPPAAAA